MSASSFRLCAASQHLGKRVDKVLALSLAEDQTKQEILAKIVPTRSKIAQWIAEGHLKVNRQVVKRPGYLLRAGDVLELEIPQVQPLRPQPDPTVSLAIVYEDDDLLVVNKPAGLVVHPGAGNPVNTLVNGILAHLGQQHGAVGEVLRPGIVHRLDKDTSGLMVIAKNDFSYQGLIAQFTPPRRIAREYLAITLNLPSTTVSPSCHSARSGEIALPLGRDPRNRKKIAARPDGKEAQTFWSVEEEYRQGYLLRLLLRTGRTHQIRVHLQSVGAAILGDPVYGEKRRRLPARLQTAVQQLGRQALHAARLEFIHPRSGELMKFAVALPADMVLVLQALNEG